MFLLGLGCGVYVKLSTPLIKTQPIKKQKKIPTNESSFLPDVRVMSSSGEGLSIPTFRDGFRSSELTAEKIVWKKDGPVELTKPVIYEFGPDGITLITKMSGDCGEIKLNIQTKELNDVHIWGNIRIIRAQQKEEEEKKDEKEEEKKDE